MKYKVNVGVNFSGRDFSEEDISYTVFVSCDMTGIKLPITLNNMQDTHFVNCKFNTKVVDERGFIAPLYEAKYRIKNIKLSIEVELLSFNKDIGRYSFSSRNLTSLIEPSEISWRYSVKSAKNRPYYCGYKILDIGNDEYYPVMATLKIYEDTPAALFAESKCRAERVTVLSIRDFYNNEYNSARSYIYPGNVTVYEVGKEVVADSWDPNSMNECTNGIHFFLTQKEAWQYAIQ